MADNPAYEMIWQVVGAIPPGSVATYGQVAELAGLPRGARLVGRCLGNLPAGSRLPWHRVINSAGRISLPPDSESYREQVKRLQEEGVAVFNGRVKLRQFRWTGD